MTVTLYDKGEILGDAKVVQVDDAIVVEEIAPIIVRMKADAKAEKINLILAVGYRSFEKQLELRHQNVIDKTRSGDMEYLKNAPSTDFNPVTAKPGWSNHHDGKAYDFNVTGYPRVYAWLVKNALRYGFVRTVLSERWHWEHLPDVKNMFAYVPKYHTTWDGLV